MASGIAFISKNLGLLNILYVKKLKVDEGVILKDPNTKKLETERVLNYF